MPIATPTRTEQSHRKWLSKCDPSLALPKTDAKQKTCSPTSGTFSLLRGCFQSFLQPLFPKSLAGSLCQVEDGPGTHGLGASCDRRNSTLLCGCQRRTTDSLCPILGKDICRQRQIFHDLGQVILQLFNGFSVSRFPVWRHTDGATW